MSCSLFEFCRLQEFKTVRHFLFRNEKSEPVEEKNQTGNEEDGGLLQLQTEVTVAQIAAHSIRKVTSVL